MNAFRTLYDRSWHLGVTLIVLLVNAFRYRKLLEYDGGAVMLETRKGELGIRNWVVMIVKVVLGE